MRRNNTFITGKATAVKILCLLFTIFFASQADAQTPVFRSSTIYAGSSPFQDSLWTSDSSNYAIVRRLGPSLTGFTITGITGIATDPTTGTHYAILKISGQPTNRKLATINVQTGVCTEVGNLGDRFASLAFNANGSLFGVTGNGATVPETMFRIDKTNATTSLFRALGSGADGEIIAYCPDNNFFYHWSGNGTVIWERFDTTGIDPVQPLTYSGTTGGETFGALYVGNGKFLISNISSNFRIWDTSGAIGPVVASNPDDLRGLVRESYTTSITPSTSPILCAGSSITFTVSSGTSNYQWYKDGAIISGETNSTYVTNTAGVYNCVYTDQNGITDSPATGFNVVVNPIPTITLGAIPGVCAGSTTGTIPFSGATDVISKTVTMSYTGGAQTWTVPAGVTSVMIDAHGAAGGLNSEEIIFPNRAGYGGRVQATLAVTPGQVLNIYVGGKGGDGTTTTGGAAGFNGGGNGSFGVVTYSGGGGGGATDIRIGGVTLADRVLVAGGGGGAGLDCGGDQDRGGDGGGTTGEDGMGLCNGGNGFGGTPTAGGAGGVCGACIGSAGMPGTFGTGGDAGAGTAGGGGGGGYYGGGGSQWDGAGGGSSYTDALLATSVAHTRGTNTTNGIVSITYSIPTTYSIVWDVPSSTAGFVGVTNAAISASPITIAVPGSAPVNTYNGTLTMTNSWTGCTSASLPIAVTVNPIPDVNPVSGQTICNGASSTAITFAGTYSGTTFSWTNSNSSIGLAASGSGNIGAFIAANSSSVPVTAVVTVTPSRLGCVGPVQTFTITVNPTPDVAAGTNQTLCNGDATAAITFTGSVAGTVFDWTNSDNTIGLASSGSGNIASFTATNSTTAPVSAVITVNTTANGCTGSSNSFTILVNPTPVFTSLLNPPAICDNTLFSYTPTSATSGTTFAWDRAAVTGISNPAASGSGDPMETLMNTTPNPITVVYVYTLTANSCTNTQSVSVVVNPTPVLTSPLTPAAVCDSTLFTYIYSSATAGTTYSWTRGVVSGISNASGSGVDTIMEVLDNTTPNPITVTYVNTLMANGCSNTQIITVAVNPTPMLTTPLTISPVCNNTVFTYVPASATTGTTFTWSRAAITGISNPAANGADTISETLNNTTANPITVIYVDTLKANGCVNTQQISIIVYPTPMLSSSLTPPGKCDSTVFNYTPTSNTLGTTFSWVRPFVLGLGLPAGSGTGNPNEQLINNTNNNLTIAYIYTLAANGCTNTQTVNVVVHPTPRLSSSLSGSSCSGSNFHYVPTGYAFGTTYAWNRTAVTGLTPATGSGTGIIDEVLTHSLLTPVNTTYRIILTANGCSHTQYVAVTVNPAPPVLPITTHPPSSLCASTRYQNFGTSSMPPAGQQYHWSATNATVWANGAGGQYSLVSFNNPGTAVVTLNSNIAGFGCVTNSSFTVSVGSAVSDAPQVVYFAGQLICLQSDEDSYQWGFDDGITLDSTIIPGEMNPNYFISGPDFTHRHYWVITKRGDCMQKSYYNAPVGITNVNTGDQTSMKLYPNPASEMVNVEINTTVDGNYELDVINLLGQELNKTKVADRKARIDVASLPSGVYLVDCYRDGIKVATQRFIKN